jgi:hypothetical protein
MIYHVHFQVSDGTHTIRVYTVEILRAMSHFKNIIGFSSKTPISITQSLTTMNPTDTIIRCDFETSSAQGLYNI